MTEDQIERSVEIKMTALDRRYLRGDLTDLAYGAEISAIDDWAREQLRFAKRED